MTRPATTIDTARSAIARQKLEQRLEGMRARGEGAAMEREDPFCLTCGRKLKAVLCGFTCNHCGKVFVDVEHNGIKARWLVRAGKRRYQRVTSAVCEQCCETIAAMVRGDERKGAA